MIQQTKTYGKDEIVLEMDEQMRIVTLCHNCHFRNLQSNVGANLWSFNKNMVKPCEIQCPQGTNKQDDEEMEGDEVKEDEEDVERVIAAIVAKQNV